MKSLLRNVCWGKVFVALLPLLAATALAFASSEGGGDHGGSAKIIDFAWRILNFAVLAFILYKLTWKKIKEFFIGRREEIKASLEQAVVAKEEAERKFQEYSERLDKATEEIAGIAEMIRAQGAAERGKIVDNAKKTAEKMKEDARTRMDQDMKKASNALRAEASELSVKMAEDILKNTVKKEDHENMVRDFLERMVTKH